MENSESLMANDVWSTPDTADKVMSPQKIYVLISKPVTVWPYLHRGTLLMFLN